MKLRFEEDDIVHFEVSPHGKDPRWILNEDKGKSGEYAEGIVTHVTSVCIKIDALFPDGKVYVAKFPNKRSSDYLSGQWDFPGYLRHGEKLPSCNCGQGDNSGTHWLFCNKHRTIREQSK